MTAYTYYTASTIDGFLADPNDSLDWLLSQPIDDDGPFSIAELMAGTGTIAMGATTYEWLVEHTAGEPWSYPEQQTFVFTHRDLAPVHPTVTRLAGPPAEHRARLEDAAGDRGVWVVGGGGLAAQFAAAGMLDEMIVSYAPVTLGSGRSLFTEPFDFELLDTARNRAFAIARYRVVGARKAAPSQR
ncbi:MAG: dihydrofolate reductase family protein [Gordonia sp. (in: high G+C Gram-positive bacteria)]|uniref:dihydrofolate reductase family protein n=1 Tax=Gordonia sp. (in: high G+C Gram-positive bacteria) TaxID=84139 RepID=UPI003C74317F